MIVQIVRAGIYLDEKLRRKKCEMGEKLMVKGWYGNSLVTDGLATEIREETPKAKKPPKPSSARNTAKNTAKNQGGKKNGPPSNPFLL